MGLRFESDSRGEWTLRASGIDYMSDDVLASVAEMVETATRVCSGESAASGRLYRAHNLRPGTGSDDQGVSQKQSGTAAA